MRKTRSSLTGAPLHACDIYTTIPSAKDPFKLAMLAISL
jgi:hypothetical protein